MASDMAGIHNLCEANIHTLTHTHTEWRRSFGDEPKVIFQVSEQQMSLGIQSQL